MLSQNKQGVEVVHAVQAYTREGVEVVHVAQTLHGSSNQGIILTFCSMGSVHSTERNVLK